MTRCETRNDIETMTEQERNKPGRPAIGRRRVVIVSDEQWERWKSAAAESGETLADMIRRVVEREATALLD